MVFSAVGVGDFYDQFAVFSPRVPLGDVQRSPNSYSAISASVSWRSRSRRAAAPGRASTCALRMSKFFRDGTVAPFGHCCRKTSRRPKTNLKPTATADPAVGGRPAPLLETMATPDPRNTATINHHHVLIMVIPMTQPPILHLKNIPNMKPVPLQPNRSDHPVMVQPPDIPLLAVSVILPNMDHHAPAPRRQTSSDTSTLRTRRSLTHKKHSYNSLRTDCLKGPHSCGGIRTA